MLNPDPRRALDLASDAAAVQRRALVLALAMLAVAAVTILGALGFEHIGGYLPCALCLMQRPPYYLGVPVAAAAVLAAWFHAPRILLAALFAVFALLMLYGGAIAIYHSGVEWGFWEGPAACAQAPSGGSAADLLSQLDTVTPPSCTEAIWRFLGLSFAGWNVLVSAFLAVLSLYGIALTRMGRSEPDGAQ